jgi:hypothetical protein
MSFLATKPAPINLHTTGGLPLFWDDADYRDYSLEPFLAERASTSLEETLYELRLMKMGARLPNRVHPRRLSGVSHQCPKLQG